MICETQTEPPRTHNNHLLSFGDSKRKQCSHLYICVLRFSMNLNHGVVVDKHVDWVLILHYWHASGPRLLVKSRVFSVCLFKSAFKAGVCPGISLFLAHSESVDVFSTRKVGLSVKERYWIWNASWVLSLFTRPRFPGERRSDASCRLSSDLRWIVGVASACRGFELHQDPKPQTSHWRRRLKVWKVCTSKVCYCMCNWSIMRRQWLCSLLMEALVKVLWRHQHIHEGHQANLAEVQQPTGRTAHEIQQSSFKDSRYFLLNPVTRAKAHWCVEKLAQLELYSFFSSRGCAAMNQLRSSPRGIIERGYYHLPYAAACFFFCAIWMCVVWATTSHTSDWSMIQSVE